ncbi:hypothetical protein BT69DRAFT_1298307 [Atractiella rhizophila]|nr:hypothetical protein BT69DRAFT_1298307 [Atractiella rhizophila]
MRPVQILTDSAYNPVQNAPCPEDPSSDADTDPLIPPRNKSKSKVQLSREVSPDLEVLNGASPPMGQKSIGNFVKSYFASHPDLPMILGLPRLEDPGNLTNTHKFLPPNSLIPAKIESTGSVNLMCEIEIAKAASAAKEKDTSLEAVLTRIASLESELQVLHQFPPLLKKCVLFDLDDLPSIDECKCRRISSPIENTSTIGTQRIGDTTKSRKDLVKDAWSSKQYQTLDIDPNMNPSFFLVSVAPRIEEWIQHHPYAYVPLNIFAESTKHKVEVEFNESKGSLNSENPAGLSIVHKYVADTLLTSKADWDFGLKCTAASSLRLNDMFGKFIEQCHRAHFGSEDNWEIMFNEARMEVSDLIQLKSSSPFGNTSFSLGTSNTLPSQPFRQPFHATALATASTGAFPSKLKMSMFPKICSIHHKSLVNSSLKETVNRYANIIKSGKMDAALELIAKLASTLPTLIEVSS